VILSREQLQEMIVNKLEIRCSLADDVVKQAEGAKLTSDSSNSTYAAHIRTQAMVDATRAHAATLREALESAKAKLLVPARLDRMDVETQLEIQEWLEISESFESVKKKGLKEAETTLSNLADLQRQRRLGAQERSKILSELAEQRPKTKCKKYIWMGLCNCC